MNTHHASTKRTDVIRHAELIDGRRVTGRRRVSTLCGHVVRIEETAHMNDVNCPKCLRAQARIEAMSI